MEYLDTDQDVAKERELPKILEMLSSRIEHFKRIAEQIQKEIEMN